MSDHLLSNVHTDPTFYKITDLICRKMSPEILGEAKKMNEIINDLQ